MNDDYVDKNGATQFRSKCVEMTKEELKGIYPELYKLMFNRNESPHNQQV